MSRRPQWSYVQARLQARHGERLDDNDWRTLEAARSVDQFLERSRSTALRRFADHLDATMSSHAMERMLRTAWRNYVAEIAGWMTPAWQPAVQWLEQVPDLPVIDAVLKGKAPAWARSDPVFSVLATDPHQHKPNREARRLLPLFANSSDVPLARRWLDHWHSLWPRQHGPERAWLGKFGDAVKEHVQQLDRAGLRDSSGSYRRALANILTRLFRRCSGTPVAVFCHLALVALDLERLRGGLVRRRLFEPDQAAAS